MKRIGKLAFEVRRPALPDYWLTAQVGWGREWREFWFPRSWFWKPRGHYPGGTRYYGIVEVN